MEPTQRKWPESPGTSRASRNRCSRLLGDPPFLSIQALDDPCDRGAHHCLSHKPAPPALCPSGTWGPRGQGAPVNSRAEVSECRAPEAGAGQRASRPHPQTEPAPWWARCQQVLAPSKGRQGSLPASSARRNQKEAELGLRNKGVAMVTLKKPTGAGEERVCGACWSLSRARTRPVATETLVGSLARLGQVWCRVLETHHPP